MGRLVYFMPGHQTASLEKRERWGMGYVGGGPQAPAQVEGREGVLFSSGEGALKAGGGWHRVPGTEAFVRLEGELLPGDLARARTFPGYWVELADGNRWHVPAVRGAAGTTPLPRSVVFDGSAWKEGEVEARWRGLWDQACEFFDALQAAREGGESSFDMEDSDLYALAANALAANYRLGAGEISALGLLNTQCATEAALAVVDWPMVLGKQEASGSPGSEPGSGG